MGEVKRSAGMELTSITAPDTSKADQTMFEHYTLLYGIGTAVPPHSASQEQSCGFMQRVLMASGQVEASQLGLLKRLYKSSAIQRRHSVIQDYIREDPAEFEFFPKNQALHPFPTTAARMAQYENHAVELAAEAARKAIEQSGIAPEQFTHIVISTCTGFFAPGPDILLLRKLGLPTSTARTVLGFMGCYAGLSAMRVCHDIVQADNSAVVLQVSVELCSLHYQKTSSPETLVANALFSDGAAAAVYAGNCFSNAASDAGPLAQVLATHSDISPDTVEHMSWRIGDHGFIMTLDAGIPSVLQQAVPAFVQDLANAADVTPDEINGWVIHPGGRKIVESLQDALELSAVDIESSMAVLRDYGNMSSATILFVLQAELLRRTSGDVLAAMAFGPGLTMEGVLLESR